MSNILDPATVVGNAMVALLNSDQVTSFYNWQSWESDADVVLPRGHVNVICSTPLVDAGAPMQFEIEVVFEGKPKRGSAAVVVAEALGQIQRPTLATVLEALITDGSVTFQERAAENIKLIQQIQGDVRRRSISFTLFGHWNVVYQ